MQSPEPVAGVQAFMAPRQGVPQIREDHAVQRRICDSLECLADHLPEPPSEALLMQIGQEITEIVTHHFPRAEAVIRNLRPDGPALEQLAWMHALDATHAEDLMAALWDLAARRRSADKEQLGYMLRCFFDGCRRAMAYKEALIAGAGTRAADLN